MVHKSKHTSKRKETKKKEEQQKQQTPTTIHLHQLGSTSAIETPKLRDGELDRLLEAITKEASTRNRTKQERIEKMKADEVEFLTKCRNLTQIVIPWMAKTDTDIEKPLEREYQLLESVMSNL